MHIIMFVFKVTCVSVFQIEELEKKLVDRTQEVERLRSELVSDPVLTLCVQRSSLNPSS